MDGESFDRKYRPEPHNTEADELLDLFLGTGEGAGSSGRVEEDLSIDPLPSLFSGHYHWAEAALKRLEARGEALQWSADPQRHHIGLTITEELRHRFRLLPREIYPEQGRFELTDDLEVIKREIVRSREDENAWPKIHYLWPQHPVMEWLTDRMLTTFGRHTAPVIEYRQGLAPGEVVYLVSGTVPNRKGHPLVSQWIAVRFVQERFQGIEPFRPWLERIGLGKQPIPNTGRELPLETLQRWLPQAMDEAFRWVRERRDAFEDEINQKLDAQLKELERLRAAQLEQLGLQLDSSRLPAEHKRHRRHQREREINELFDQYMEWVEETMTTEPQPWLQLVAVLCQDK